MSNRHIKRQTGRPSKYTIETRQRLIELVSKGVPFSWAARGAGVSPSSFAEWRNKDADFEADIQQAVAKAIEARLDTILKAAETDWRSCAWYLEHVHASDFAKTRVEISGPGGAPLGAAVAVYLPQKDDALAVEAPAENRISNGH